MQVADNIKLQLLRSLTRLTVVVRVAIEVDNPPMVDPRVAMLLSTVVTIRFGIHKDE